MSEQSGGGHITREQVERAIAKPRNIDYRELPPGWREWAPDYVIAAEAADDWDAEHAALTRWRDELVAAETPRKVARWDAGQQGYALPDGKTFSTDVPWLKALGYEIEGGPEPVDDTAPERLRERREALGWTTAYAGHWVAWFDHTDVERAECGRGVPAFVARYAAALSAEEERRAELAEEERLACAYRESDGTLVWDDSPLPEPAEDSPERLRERRERLGWTTAYAGHWVPWFDHTDVERAESGRGITAFVARYAAALSAEEERRGAQLLADEEARAEAFHAEPDHLAYADSPVWDDGPLPTPTPERPAPRFKVGDWVRDGSRGFRVAEMHWDDSDVVPMWYARAAVGVAEGIAESSLESYAGPASPPAPEVVDVPQPETWHARLVRLATEAQAAGKACAEAEAVFAEADAIREKTRLIRASAREVCHAKRQALTEATTARAIVDAQQGGAS